jgi:hypothetical protein
MAINNPAVTGAGYSLVNQVALKNTASAQVFEKFIQGILHVNGRGVDESYINGSALGSQSIAIPHVALGAGDFRLLGASVNGGQFNGKAAVGPESDYFYVPILYVYDRTETLARIMNDKAGYDLLSAKTDNIRKKITRGINALTFAVQISHTLNASADGTPTYVTEAANTPLYENYTYANALLDEGDEAIGADYFPTEMRQAFWRPTAFAKLKNEKGVILASNYGQEMLATGVLNPFRNSEASKVDFRDGYCGEIDGVSCYKFSPIILKLAAKYCQKDGTTLAETAFDKVDAVVCSGVGTIRGFTSTGDVEVVPAQAGQGWVLQPLVHGGCSCISAKSVRLIVASDFANPATAEAKLAILPPESQQV